MEFHLLLSVESECYSRNLCRGHLSTRNGRHAACCSRSAQTSACTAAQSSPTPVCLHMQFRQGAKDEQDMNTIEAIKTSGNVSVLVQCSCLVVQFTALHVSVACSLPRQGMQIFRRFAQPSILDSLLSIGSLRQAHCINQEPVNLQTTIRALTSCASLRPGLRPLLKSTCYSLQRNLVTLSEAQGQVYG